MLDNSFLPNRPSCRVRSVFKVAAKILITPSASWLRNSCVHNLLEEGSLMSEDDYFAALAALNEHLQEVRPIFDDFCVRNEFVYVDRKSLGQYPRIRIERPGATKIWFDLWMEFDKDGHRFEQFRRDLPYELSAGAYFDMPDGSRYGTRFQKGFQCFSGKPFDQVAKVLQSEMQRHFCTLEEWDVQYLKENGQKVHLGV